MGMLQAGNNHHAMPYRDEHLAMDFAQQAVILDSERMTLTRKEYDLLALLVQHAGEIIPRDALLMQVWGYGARSARVRWTSMYDGCARSWAAMPISTSRPSSASDTASSRSMRRGSLRIHAIKPAIALGA